MKALKNIRKGGADKSCVDLAIAFAIPLALVEFMDKVPDMEKVEEFSNKCLAAYKKQHKDFMDKLAAEKPAWFTEFDEVWVPLECSMRLIKSSMTVVIKNCPPSNE